MSYTKKLTSEELQRIFAHLLAKDTLWIDSLWQLTEYLVNIEFSKRCLAVSREKAWDATTEIFGQLKQRIDCKERMKKNGETIKPEPIENIVRYVYFALPKRFSKWCSMIIAVEEHEKSMVRIDTYNPETRCFEINNEIERQLATEMRVDIVSHQDTERQILEWLGRAQNNIELKIRRQKLKAQGWAIIDGKLVQQTLTQKEMARELAVLESQHCELPSNEERRLQRIKFLQGELYGKNRK